MALNGDDGNCKSAAWFCRIKDMEADMKGYFISFEGPDGAGKSTALAKILHQIKPSLSLPYLLTREPGGHGSEIAEKIRKLILDPANQKMAARTEALLYAASRSQHVEEVIKPALRKGKIVFSDRYVDSSLAYQGAGRQIGLNKVKAINDFAIRGLLPDLTIFFDLKPEKGLARIKRERPDNEDRLEQEKLAFHERVYAGFQEIIARNPERIAVVNADQTIDKVVNDTIIILKKRIPEIFK